MKFKIFNLLPSYGTNTYLIWDKTTKEAAIIDPAAPSENLLRFIKELSLNMKCIINTHCHADHIGGNQFFATKLNIPIYISKLDAEGLTNPKRNLSSYMGEDLVSATAKKTLKDNDIIKLGKLELKVITTPGHTVGGISLYSDGLLFSGDTLFAESVGRTDLPGGNMKQLIASIKQKLFKLPDNTTVLPGHGPSSSIEDEKVANPFAGLAARL